ncbi:hypothetical protein EDC02_3681 [Micromonospora sp. Llam0]|uniref:hypothetical protein n=1 Tax=Micromonospora sp. Llam0 TaxID=2485143 RepID=UPI000F9ED0AA|nr:hypothetical protein [Micromonospora sp. Llam0]ROO61729.1 hypothetical protein EDC02_3681 [Micromonospora sp. Llam0]
MAQRPERDTTTPGFTVPDAAPGELALPDVALPDVALPDVALPDVALPDVALPVEGRRRARAAAPGSGPQTRSARPDRLAGRGQRAGKGRNYQFRRS